MLFSPHGLQLIIRQFKQGVGRCQATCQEVISSCARQLTVHAADTIEIAREDIERGHRRTTKHVIV